MFNDYWSNTESPSLEFIDFLVEVTPRNLDGTSDDDFLDFIYGDGQ